MNKALINKYKNEFDYWLKEGELLIGYRSKVEPTEWNVLVEDDWDYCISKFTIVINDEYVELRKALAEGKTIQAYYDFNETWNDIKNPEFKDLLENYRVKPNE